MSVSVKLGASGLGGLVGLQAATQYIGWTFQWADVLGRGWRVGSDWVLYAPWSILEWRARFGAEEPGAFSASTALVLLGTSVGLGLGVLLEGDVRTSRVRGWGGLAEARQAALLVGSGAALGTLRGRLLATVDLRPTLVTGGTRSGKGRGHVIPTLLSWSESVLVHDPKRELFHLSAVWRATFSHCLFFNPRDPASARWNPLDGRCQTQPFVGCGRHMRARAHADSRAMSCRSGEAPVAGLR